GGSVFRLGSFFAPGAVLLQEIPIAACWPGRALNRRSTRPGCDWGWLGVLAGLRFAPGAVLLHEIPQPRAGRGTLRTVGAPAPGAIGAGSGLWLGSAFAPGAVLLHEIPAAACRRGVLLQEMPIAAGSPGRAPNRRSTRPGRDWGGPGVLTGLRSPPGGGGPNGKPRRGASAGRAPTGNAHSGVLAGACSEP